MWKYRPVLSCYCLVKWAYLEIRGDIAWYRRAIVKRRVYLDINLLPYKIDYEIVSIRTAERFIYI